MNLNEEENLSYMHHLFGGDAKRFHRSEVTDQVDTFDDCMIMMDEEYNSIIRCRQVLNRLEVNQVMKGKQLTIPEALSCIQERVTYVCLAGGTRKSYRCPPKRILV